MDALLQLRYSIAADRAVKEGSVRRAAKQMHVSPAALCLELDELERASGVKLFIRKRDRIETTEGGRAFLEAVTGYLLRHGAVMGLGKDAAAAVRQTLTVGRTPYADPELVFSLLNLRLPSYPDMQVQMYSDFALELCEAVKAGRLDLAVVANPEPNEELAAIKVSELPFYIGLPNTHALAARESVTLRDLSKSAWILFERKVHPGMYDAILRCAQEDGVVVERGPHIVTAEEAFHFLSQNIGVAFLNQPSARSLARRGIRVKPLVDERLRVEVYLVWRPERAPRLVTDFVDAFANRVLEPAPEVQLTVPVQESAAENPTGTVVVKHARGEVVLEAREVVWIQAEDYYVAIHYGHRKYLMRESLSSLEARLEKERFVRVHRGALVNLEYVREITVSEKKLSQVILSDGTRLPLSRRRRAATLRALERWN